MQTLDILYFVFLIVTLTYAFYKLYPDPSVRLIPVLLTVTALVYGIAAYLKFVGINNLILYHLFTPMEYTFYSVVFYQNIIYRSTKTYIALSIPALFAFSFISGIFIEGLENNNSYAGMLSNCLLIIWSLVYLYMLSMENSVVLLHKYPLCWISVGLLFYNSGNLVTQGPLNYLMNKDMTLAAIVYHLSYIFSFLLFMSIIAASYFVSKPIKTYAVQ